MTTPAINAGYREVGPGLSQPTASCQIVTPLVRRDMTTHSGASCHMGCRLSWPDNSLKSRWYRLVTCCQGLGMRYAEIGIAPKVVTTRFCGISFCISYFLWNAISRRKFVLMAADRPLPSPTGCAELLTVQHRTERRAGFAVLFSRHHVLAVPVGCVCGHVDHTAEPASAQICWKTSCFGQYQPKRRCIPQFDPQSPRTHAARRGFLQPRPCGV